MIALQGIAAVLGAGLFCWIYSPELGADVVLAIVACLA